MSHGITVKSGEGGSRVEVQCVHQNGLLYVVPGEASWVCSDELRPAHALAGFLRELTGLEDPRIRDLMRRWGLYFRERPLEPEEGTEEPGSTQEAGR